MLQTAEQTKQLQQKAKGRQQFKHNNQLIYEWDQTIDEVNIYIKPPDFVLPKYRDEVRKQLQPGEPLPQLDIKIVNNRVTIGIKGNPPFIDQKLSKNCDTSQSFWMIEDDELHINLQKQLKADLWPSVFEGHGQLDPLLQSEVQKNILLERFQEDYTGYDFSEAEFNGMPPDPRTFMGGLNYK